MSLRDFLGEVLGKNWSDMSEQDKADYEAFFQKNPDRLEKFIYDTTGDLFHQIEEQNPGVVRAIVGNLVGGGVGEAAKSAIPSAIVGTAKGLAGTLTPLGITSPYEALGEVQEGMRPYLKPGMPETIYGGLTSAAQNIGMLGGAAGLAATGIINPASIPLATGIALGTVAGGETAGEHIAQGGSGLGAFTKGALAGAAEGLFERYTLGGMFAPGAVRNLGTAALEGAKIAGREIPSELMTEGANIALDYAFGTGQPTDLQSNLSRLGEVAKATAISAPIVGAGSAAVSTAISPMIEQRARVEIDKLIEQTKAKRADFQTKIQEGLASGDIQYIDEQTEPDTNLPPSRADQLKVNPNEGDIELSSALPGSEPLNMELSDGMGNIRVDSAGERVYNEGEPVFIKSRIIKGGGKESTVLGGTPFNPQVTPATVISVNEDGTITVETGDGQTVNIERAQLVSDVTMGQRGVNLQIDPEAPSFLAMRQVSKEFAQEAGGFLKQSTKIKPGQIAGVSVDPTTGRPIKFNMDWAIQRFPDLVNVSMAHELGHILSLGGGTSAIPGMDTARPQSSSLYGKLSREYHSSKKWILKEPVTKLPVWDAMQSEQQQFVDRMKAQYAAANKPWDKSVQEDIQKNWNKIMNEQGFKSLSGDQKNKIEAEVQRQITEEMRANKTPRYSRSEYRKTRAAELRTELTIQAYAEKGMLYLPVLREELEAVMGHLRGLPRDSVLRKQAASVIGNLNEEMYADFFSAKVLGTRVNIGGQWVNLVDTVAPNLSRMFDQYREMNPAMDRLLDKALAYTNDMESMYAIAAKETLLKDSEYQAQRQEADPEYSWLVSRYGALTGGWYKFVNGIFNANAMALRSVNPEARPQVQENLERLSGLSALNQNFLLDVQRVLQPTFDLLSGKSPDMNPEEHFGNIMILKRIASGERTRDLDTIFKDANGKWVKVSESIPLLSGNWPQNAKEAQKWLDNLPYYQQNKEIIDRAFGDFQNLWQERILKGYRDSGMLSQEAYERLQQNKNYAMYAIVKSHEEHPLFKAVAPAIKQMYGSLNANRNPLYATIEHGIALQFVSHLNQAKQSIVENLPDDLKRRVEPSGRLFPEPRDRRNWSLVTYKKDGVDFGYHVPTAIVEGIEFGGVGDKYREALIWLGKTSPYFRKLLTTYRPTFLGRNVLKDALRMFKNAENPETGGWGAGIISKWFGVVGDSFWGDAEALEQEVYNMREQSLVLSDYDYSLRDASYDSILKTLLNQYDQAFRNANENLPKAGAFSSLLRGTVERVTNALETAGRVTERWSKRAAYRYYKPFLEKGIIDQNRFNQLVRKSGSPYFPNKGSWHPLTGNLAMFFNPAMQGLYEDIARMRESKAVAQKTALSAGITLAMQTAMVDWFVSFAGAAGEEWKEVYNRIPWRDLDNNICIPLGLTTTGKAVYLRFPLDENTAMFKKVLRKVMNSRHNTWGNVLTSLGKGGMAAVSEMTDVSMNPFLKALWDLSLIMKDVNPPDYRGKPSINETAWEAGGSALVGEVAKMFYNQLSPTTPIYRFGYTDPLREAKVRVAGGPNSEMQAVADYLERGLELPFAQELIRAGFVNISDQGVHDYMKNLSEADRAYSAQLTLETKKLAGAALNESKAEVDAALEAIRTLAPVDAVQAEIFKRRMDAIPTLIKRSGKGLINPFLTNLLAESRAIRLRLLQDENIGGAL